MDPRRSGYRLAMAEAAEDAHEEMGTVTIHRILGVRDDYLSSRPSGVDDIVHRYEDSPMPGVTTVVTLGGPPTEFISAWRQSWAWIVNSLGGVAHCKDTADPVACRDDVCDRTAESADLPEGLRAQCGLWVG